MILHRANQNNQINYQTDVVACLVSMFLHIIVYTRLVQRAFEKCDTTRTMFRRRCIIATITPGPCAEIIGVLRYLYYNYSDPVRVSFKTTCSPPIWSDIKRHVQTTLSSFPFELLTLPKLYGEEIVNFGWYD